LRNFKIGNPESLVQVLDALKVVSLKAQSAKSRPSIIMLINATALPFLFYKCILFLQKATKGFQIEQGTIHVIVTMVALCV